MIIYVHFDRYTKRMCAGWNPPADVSYSEILEVHYDEGERPDLMVEGEELGVL